MATEKRYGVFCKRTHEEVHGIGATSKEDMQRWCDTMPGYYIGMLQVTDEDRWIGDYVPVPA